MTKILYLHIGLHKTGTTAIQSALRQNKKQLLAAGVLIPETGYAWGSNHQLAWAFLDNNPSWYPVSDMSREALYRQLKDEINQTEANKVVISSEDFSLLSMSADKQSIESLKKLLGGMKVKIVIYLRPQANYIDSFYQEAVKSYDTRFNTESIQTLQSDIQGLLDYNRLIEKWSATFGSDSLVVRPYGKRANGFDSVRDFLGLLGVSDIPLKMAKPENNRLSQDLMTLKQSINSSDVADEVKVALASVMAKISTSGFCSQLTMKETKSFYENYKVSNRLVADLYGFDERELNEFNEESFTPCSEVKPINSDLLTATQLIGALKTEFYEFERINEQLFERLGSVDQRLAELEKSQNLFRTVARVAFKSINSLFRRTHKSQSVTKLDKSSASSLQFVPEKNHSESQQKHIVFIDHEIPRYDTNAGARHTYQYLEFFVEMGWKVSFLPFIDSEQDTERYRESLTKRGINVVSQHELPEDIKKSNDRWRSWLKDNQNEISVVFIHRPHIGRTYMPFCKEDLGLKVWYMCHDIHFLRLGRQALLQKSPRLLLEKLKLQYIEKKLFKMADVCFTPSKYEEQIIKKRLKIKDVVTLPLYIYSDINFTPREKPAKKDMVFIGSFDHNPNVDGLKWFLEDIFNRVKAEHPDTVLHIVGKNPPVALKEYHSTSVVFHDYLSDQELSQLLTKVYMMIVPLRYGAGVKGKVLDALSRGLPLVSTSCGLEGIEKIKRHVSGTDDAKSFADEIVHLFSMSDSEYSDLSIELKSIVREGFTSAAVYSQLESYLEKI